MSRAAPPTGTAMGSHTARRPFVLLLLAVAALLTGFGRAVLPAAADDPVVIDPGPVKPMVFPVIGDVYLDDWFWAPRANGPHLAQDLMGEKMQPLVAVDDGVVTRMPLPEPWYGYLLEITADDGWVYRYLHINDDTPGTDDGAAELTDVFGPGIEEGARVVAGQLVAFMGDSGNAEDTGPHLHFEMEDPSGAIVNPYQSLLAATRLDAPVPVDGLDSPAPSAGGSAPVTRLAGADRYGTAVAASAAAWPAGSTEVVLARGDRYAEALPASVLAGRRGAPLLLVPPTGLRDDIAAELRRLDPQRAVVVGGVPDSVDAAFRWAGVGVTRLGPPDDAVATAVAIATVVGAPDGTVLLVNRERFADGISAAAVGARQGWPVLLSEERVIPQASVDAWRALGATRVVLVGGPAVLGENVEAFVPGGVRVWGADRYATSVAVAEAVLATDPGSGRRLFLATGTAYPDSLAAGAVVARTGGLVLLVDGSGAGADAATRTFLSAHGSGAASVTVLGGPAAVSPAALERLPDG